jgi:hypothetical protein
MTDTAAPITEPHLTPMFATGGQPALAHNTEPNPAPIFDTGPHPDPLNATSAEPAVEPHDEPRADDPYSDEPQSTAWADAEWDSDEWRHAEWRNIEVSDSDPTAESESNASEKPKADRASAAESASTEEAPEAAPEVPAETSEPDSASMAADLHLALGAIDPEPNPPAPRPEWKAFSELDNVDTDAFLRSVTGHIEPVVITAQPVVVPSAYQFVKRWRFALIVAGVWVVAAAAGLGFYYWWYTAMDKTLPVFGILLYLAVCMVASVMVSMVPNRPQVTALAIALMAAPLASMAAAALLHGAYYFEWIARPMIG